MSGRGGRRIPRGLREEAEAKGLLLAVDLADQLSVSTAWLAAAEELGTGPRGRVLLRHNVAAYPRREAEAWVTSQEGLLPSLEVRKTLLAQERAGRLAGPAALPGTRGRRRAGETWLANMRAEAQGKGLILADDVATLLGVSSAHLRRLTRETGQPEGRTLLRPTVAAYDAASVTRFIEARRDGRTGRSAGSSYAVSFRYGTRRLREQLMQERGCDLNTADMYVYQEHKAHERGEHYGKGKEPSRWCIRCLNPRSCMRCKSAHGQPEGDPGRLCPACRKER